MRLTICRTLLRLRLLTAALTIFFRRTLGLGRIGLTLFQTSSLTGASCGLLKITHLGAHLVGLLLGKAKRLANLVPIAVFAGVAGRPFLLALLLSISLVIALALSAAGATTVFARIARLAVLPVLRTAVSTILRRFLAITGAPLGILHAVVFVLAPGELTGLRLRRRFVALLSIPLPDRAAKIPALAMRRIKRLLTQPVGRAREKGLGGQAGDRRLQTFIGIARVLRLDVPLVLFRAQRFPSQSVLLQG